MTSPSDFLLRDNHRYDGESVLESPEDSSDNAANEAATGEDIDTRVGVDIYMKGFWATGPVWLITYLVLERFGVDVRDEQIWPVVVTWVECVVVVLCVGRYLSRHLVKERVPIVMKSMLVWQVLMLNALNSGISIAYPSTGRALVTVPANLLIFVGLSSPVIMDACNTSRTESRVNFAVLIFCLLLAMIGNMLLFENTIMFQGFFSTEDSQGREVWTGQLTKNGVRKNVLNTEVLLLMGSLFTAFVYDKDHAKMHFCKLSRDQPGGVDGVRPVGVDVYLKAAWMTAVAWIFTYLVLEHFIDADDDQVWPVVVAWVECVSVYLSLGLYFSRHVVKERVPIVVKSVLLWQVLMLNALHTGISIAFAESGREQATVPANLLIFASLLSPVILDACNTTPTEARVSFMIITFGLLFALIGNVLFFQNAIMFEGFHATVDFQGRQVWTGQLTKNGVRRNIMSTEVLLVMGSLFTAFRHDKDHAKMHFCKLCQLKPGKALPIQKHRGQTELSAVDDDDDDK